jgi:hypothetical protein
MIIVSAQMTEEKTGEVVSFEDASHPHVHARKEEKLSKVKKAFKAATDERFKADRKQRRKKKNSKKGKRKK